MANFSTDITVMINEGVLVPKCGRIRFVYNKSGVLEGDLDNLGLSERAYNCARRGKIMTIEDIGKRWNELGRLRGAGVKTVKEIKNKYVSYYYNRLNDEERKQFWRDVVEATNNI